MVNVRKCIIKLYRIDEFERETVNAIPNLKLLTTNIKTSKFKSRQWNSDYISYKYLHTQYTFNRRKCKVLEK